MSSPISSVSNLQTPVFSSGLSNGSYDQNVLISLSVRGTVFDLPREELTALPESILLCLFPNGLMLEDQTDSKVAVDFDADTLQYVLEFFREALRNPPPIPIQNPALVSGKAAIIVLKEDLDFYIIPPRGLSAQDISRLRLAAGHHLVSNASIFDGLRKQHSATTGPGASAAGPAQGSPEQHLLDMLCASGFDPNDRWVKRYIEPNRACVTSLALALLKPKSSPSAVGTSQKLLLFWRKPARKCWWDAIEPESLSTDAEIMQHVKIWARRVWTLELSITG